MADQVTPQALRQLLERLRTIDENRQNECLASFSGFAGEDWLVLAGWAAAAMFSPSLGELRLVPPDSVEVLDQRGELYFQTRIVAPESAEQPILIDDPRRPPGGPSDPSAGRVSLNPADLAVALQLIHDHIASTMLKPSEIRDAEIAGYAAQAGLEEEFFRSLAVWESKLSPFLSPEDHADRN
jgi:hypothetical protein